MIRAAQPLKQTLLRAAAIGLRALLGPGQLTAQELQHNIDHIDNKLRRPRNSQQRFTLSRERASLQRLLDARQANEILT